MSQVKQTVEEYVKENGLRKTARMFGKSTQWVLDRYEYTAITKNGKLKEFRGPPLTERCFPLLEREQS